MNSRGHPWGDDKFKAAMSMPTETTIGLRAAGVSPIASAFRMMYDSANQNKDTIGRRRIVVMYANWLDEFKALEDHKMFTDVGQRACAGLLTILCEWAEVDMKQIRAIQAIMREGTPT